MLARTAAVLSWEADVANVSLYRALGMEASRGAGVMHDIERWRSRAHRSYLSALRLLAYVRHLDADTLERSVTRRRVAS
jgi:hypothetical protein